ncbi:uncharacterized protein LOC142238977 [Haematobia irritans]|uniref:uncharacterized protein LOC142238977 n=1 Tax=Haematobia irritans TaxID=7368 RepID=UPI003F50488B
MVDCHRPCFDDPPSHKYRHLSVLLLDCWQREYDKRPYRNFIFDRLDFVDRLKRPYDNVCDFATIIEFIKTRNLTSIQLKGLQIMTNREDLLYDFVENLAKLRKIILKLMQLPSEFFWCLETKVDIMKVKELTLEGTPLTDEDVINLRSFLIKSKTLQYLDVSSCSINQYNFALLADGIHKSFSLIGFNASRLLGQDLSLDSEKIALAVSSLIWQNKLQTIEMEKCEFLPQDMEIMAEYLYNPHSNLLKLNVAYNKIGPDGACYLLKAISSSGTLKYLNISGCGLGTHGAEYIAQYLSACTRLESLHIQYNDIDAEGITMILLTMKKPNKVNQISLWGNKYNSKTGRILRRLIESGVLPQTNLDITYTYDDTIPGWRIIPWRK